MSVADNIIEAITISPGAPADLCGRDPAWTGGDAFADLATSDLEQRYADINAFERQLDLAPPTVSPEDLAALDEARAALLTET